jgi:LysM repeat protein
MRLKEFTNNTVANWRTIAARNKLANPDLIMPGQVLDIGDGVVMPKGTTYTVKPGDTLSGIAKNIQRGQVPDTTSSIDKPAQGGPLKPIAGPVSDEEIKKRIGADQPIPSYKYDATKDQAMLDKVQKLDREKQKLPTFRPPVSQRPKPNKTPKPPAGTGSYDGEFKKILDIESGNRDYDEFGRPVTSSKGAKFAAQVMPATNTNPGYGVKPAADSSAEESNRVGKDYFAAMKNKYGNSELAAAAYNAGPGRVDRILQKAKQTGRNWKEMLPAETQKYLDKFKSKRD